jgi:hypothetical protein
LLVWYVTWSVFQWKNRVRQRIAYVAHEEGGVGKTYKLLSPGRTQMLLGNETGSSIYVRSIAWLTEWKGNYLLLHKQAFDNKPMQRRAHLRCACPNPDSGWRQPFGDPNLYVREPFKPFKLYFSQGRFIKK